MITLKNYDDAEVNLLKQEFKTAVPPIKVEIEHAQGLDKLAEVFASERAYLGKRITCVAQGNAIPRSYSVKDIHAFSEEMFPVIFLFKTLKEVEDFSIGWKRLKGTTQLPVRTEIETEQSEKKKQEEPINEPPVNPMAENILNLVLQIWVVIGWIVSIALLIAGFISGFELCEEEWYGFFVGLAFGAIAGGLSLATFYFLWATGKIIINISNNLYRIDGKLGVLLTKH